MKPWSPDEEQTVIRLVGKGYNRHHVAGELGRSVASVVQMYARLKNQGRLPAINAKHHHSNCTKDYLSKASAEHLADKIKAYWAARGQKIETWVEAVEGMSASFAVRSSLKLGGFK